MEQIKATSSQGTQPAHAVRPKSQGQSVSDASNPAASGGFLALLAALDGAMETSTVSGTVSDEQISPSADVNDTGLSAAEASAMAAWQGVLAPIQSHTESPVGRGLVAEARLSDARVLIQTGAQVAAGSVGTSLNQVLLAGVPHGLVAETAKLDASSDLNGGAAQGPAAGWGRIASRLQSANSQRAGSAVGAIDMTAVPGFVRDSALHLNATHSVSTALLSGAGERSLSAAQTGVPGDRSAVVQSLSPEREGITQPIDGLLSAGASSRGSAESFAGGQAHGDGAGTAGAWSDGGSVALSSESGNINDSTVFADPAAVGAEEQVAEQVAYWVNQKTQNAELTLLRDGQPVEVSVSLSGNEAHVSFRSDQEQTRELLDKSMAQLSDLLRSEGLVLSGMSVGTSARDADRRGGNGDEAAQPRPRDGVRQAQVVSSAPAGTASLARGGRVTDRSVDIFV